MSMKLKDLLSSISFTRIQWPDQESFDTSITAIACDSRKVIPGALFVCIRGFQADGHEHIDEAVEAGAVAVVVERMPDSPLGAAVIQVQDSRLAQAYLATAWFGNPANDMTMIGLTGTKGKTTTAHMIKKILEAAGKKTGMIGTMGAFIGDEKIPTNNTTPDSYELQQILSQMREAGCSHVVMEVSSQGLKQHRTAGITFQYGAYLNISPDHIGAAEHADFEEYLSCKKRLFAQSECAVVNLEDAHAKDILALAPHAITFSLAQESDYRVSDIQNIWEPDIFGISFKLLGKASGTIRLNMPGRFNVENALAALCIARAEGIDMPTIQSALSQVIVKGRTQLIQDTVRHASFIIDYAHNAFSMESLLQMLKSYHPRRIICLFGGGGNKPRQRRYDMGEVAGKYADLTIITADNPRNEDLNEINKDIIEGLNVHHGEYKIILDREQAIHYLIDYCGKDDIGVLIGKGHEEYQEIHGVKYYFSEEKIISDYLQQNRS